MSLSPELPRVGLAEQVYLQLKADLFDFRLLPGDRFTEQEQAERLNVSRTPVREALFRLEREGYVQVHFRSGWSVLPFDFERFEQLYDLRIILEQAAVQSICQSPSPVDLSALVALWQISPEQPAVESNGLAQQDEDFHQALIRATGNAEMVRVHLDITEKIRIIRRLDFTQPERIAATYCEHAEILRLLTERRAGEASALLTRHILASKAEVRKITLHKLQTSRREPGATV